MMIQTTSSDRAAILKILTGATGKRAIYSYSPDFSYAVGGYLFRRDGTILFRSDDAGVLPLLLEYGLCGRSISDGPQEHSGFFYPADLFPGRAALNLISIFSARQRLINHAAGRDTFRISPDLIASLYAHPPGSYQEFLNAVRGRGKLYKGIEFSREGVTLTGFSRAGADVLAVLAEHIVSTAREKKWIRPYAKKHASRRSAMRTWLVEIGLSGPEHENTRRELLKRF